jgi:hypothetical protein
MTSLFAFAVALILAGGLVGHMAGWPMTGLWAGVLLVAGLVYWLGGKR